MLLKRLYMENLESDRDGEHCCDEAESGDEDESESEEYVGRGLARGEKAVFIDLRKDRVVWISCIGVRGECMVVVMLVL